MLHAVRFARDWASFPSLLPPRRPETMAPSSFGDREYWDERYAKRTEDFDWLLPATCMDSAIVRALQSSQRPEPQVIHLGCGTSTLSYRLRKFVEKPDQIHNVDFSGPAIDMCMEKERELFGVKGLQEDPEEFDAMEWSVVDLLAADDIVQLAARRDRTPPYDVVVDKTTCDSVCCAEDRPVPPPDLMRATDSTTPDLDWDSPPVATAIHPLDILGINLAYLTPPGTHWVALSYSKDRFSGWFEAPAPRRIRSEGNCLPHPSRLWDLKSWEATPVKQDDGKAAMGIHQPEIMHYTYVLVRTDTPLARGTQQ